MRNAKNLLLMCALGFASQANAVVYSEFAHTIACTLKTSGLALGSNVYNYPMLLRITDSEVFTKAKSDGSDIRFSKSDREIPLAYQIEHWDNANNRAVIWVRIDTVYKDNNSQFVNMHFGSAGASSESNGAAVFQTSNDFIGVWHFDETAAGTGATDVYKDATANALHGDDYISSTTQVDHIGKGLFVTDNSTEAYIDLGDNDIMEPSNVTSTFWLARNSTSWKDHCVYSSKEGWNSAGWYIRMRMGSETPRNLIEIRGGNSPTAAYQNESIAREEFLPQGEWVHFGVKINDAGKVSLYRNGVKLPVVYSSADSAVAPVSKSENVKAIGVMQPGSNFHQQLKELLDEFRIMNGLRSDDWIKLDYESQKTNASLVGFGAIRSTGTIAISDNNGYISTPSVQVDVIYTTEDEMWITADTNSAAAWESIADNKVVVLSAGQGVKRVFAKFRTGGANESPWIYDQTTLDTQAPDIATALGGDYSTDTWPGTIQGTASDNLSGVSSLSISLRNPAGRYWNGTTWETTETPLAVSGTANWSYAIDKTNIPSDGSYTVSMKASDGAGNEVSPAVQHTFTYNNTIPTGQVSIAGNTAYTITGDVALNLSYENSDSMKIALESDTGVAVWEAAATTYSQTIHTEGTYNIFARFKNNAGTASAWDYATVTFDKTAPTLTYSLLDTFTVATWSGTGASGTASDAIAGIDSIEISIKKGTVDEYWNGNDWVADQSWVKAAGTTNWSLEISTAKMVDGSYVVQARAIDNAGNVGSVASGNNIFDFYHSPSAKFGISAASAAVGQSVSFYDSSTGVISSHLWQFGDGKTSVFEDPGHTYDAVGTYSVSLVVSGPGGRDSLTKTDAISIFEMGANPVSVAANYANSTTLSLTLGNVDTVPTSSLDPPYATQIGVWISRNGQPPDTSQSAMTTQLAIADLLNDPTVDVTVDAPATTEHKRYLVWVAPLWNNGVNEFNTANAAFVDMMPVNNFNVSGEFLGNTATLPDISLDTSALDSATFAIRNADKIDAPGVVSVAVEYGFVGDGALAADTIAFDDFVNRTANSEFVYGIRNPAFALDSGLLYFRIVQIGANTLASAAVAETLLVGWPLPDNPVTLSISNVSSSRITLEWNQISDVDSVRILWGKAPIPSNPANIANYNQQTPDIGATGAVIAVDKETRYYFGMQVMKHLHWSKITQQAMDDDSTPSYCDTCKIPNTASIEKIWFDTLTNKIKIDWDVDPIPPLDLNLGIAWSEDSVTAMTTEPIDKNVIIVTGEKGTATVDPGAAFKFRTTYWVGLWLQANGPWAPPTASGQGSVTSPDFSWQDLTYFDNQKEYDTVTAFNGNVVLWKDPTYKYPAPVYDTLIYQSVANVPDGMTPVSIGFSFTSKAFQPFQVGLKYDSIPAGYSSDALGLYRDSAGIWQAVHGFKVDESNNLVWARTDKLRDKNDNPFTFAVMTDSHPPEIAFATDTGSAIDPDSALTDSFTIDDNIGNVHWRVWYAKDGDSLDPANSLAGYVCAACQGRNGASFTIPAAFITESNGVRIVMELSDGSYLQRINLSRRANRSNSDPVTTEPMQWTPLSVTAWLEKEEPEHAYEDLNEDGGDWQYNIKQFRLYRWLANGNNVDRDDKWFEYSDDAKDIFSMQPGRLIWAKTREAVKVDFGKAVTPSNKDTLEIEVRGREWTDFALPYKYDITIGDIIKASGWRGDSLEFYAWRKNSDGKYLSDVIYSNYIVSPDFNDKGTILRPGPIIGYTVYNLYQEDFTMRIPPSPAQASPFLAKKKTSLDGWSIKVLSRTQSGEELNRVYCGYRNIDGDAAYAPSPLSFGKVMVGVYDRQRTRMYGAHIAHGTLDNGLAFELGFLNGESEAQTISFSLEGTPGIPDHFGMQIYDAAREQWQQGRNAWSVEVAPGKAAGRWLVVGGPEYFARFEQKLLTRPKLALIKAFPNPFRNHLMIHYSLPDRGVDQMRFALIDVLGRTVWKKRLTRNLTAGNHILAWDGQLGDGRTIAAGRYILSMKAYSDSGKEAGKFKQVLTFLP
ncbi:MAG: DUF2341 domain-containing protein [Chitinivibrionales bacterium]|nr:DUF2341 domain-containing protein [Chitinivibrionales bacterium]